MGEHKAAATVETVCVVDIRDNHPESTSFPYELEKADIAVPITNKTNRYNSNNNNNNPKETVSPPRTDPQGKAKSSSNNNGKRQISKSLVRSVSNMSLSNGADPNSNNNNSDMKESKKAKIRAHEEKLLALRESAWHGRAEGMDIDRSQDIDTLRESLRARKGAKNPQRGELPPLLSDVSNNAGDISNDGRAPSRGRSAPGAGRGLAAPGETAAGGGAVGAMHQSFPDEPEGILGGGGSAAAAAANAAASANNNNNTASTLTNKDKKGTKKKKKKLSETELRLMNSPLGHPLVKD